MRFGKAGLTAEAIARLNIEMLKGVTPHAIRGVLRQAGLIDHKRSRWLTGARHVTKEQVAAAEALIKERGEDLPDSAAARILRVSRCSFARVRLRVMGRILGPPRRSMPDERERRRKIVHAHFRDRGQSLVRCYVAAASLAQDVRAIPKPCALCRRPWFRDPMFYYYSASEQRPKFGTCRVCTGEMRHLRRLGKDPEQIRRIAGETVWYLPRVDRATLNVRFQNDSNMHCPDPLHRCLRCGKTWYANRNYFHRVLSGESQQSLILRVCLACPV